ncbi:MAG TPA: hypothetical protein VF824_02625 [Thermoanaerobaculia bacterium]|jgi:hypothetical protein
MKTSRIFLVLAIAALFAFPTFAKGTAGHGRAVHGTLSAVDQTAKTLTVKPSKGAAVDATWNEATKVNGGSLAVGEMATMKYMVKDGKNVATVINVQKAQAAKPAKAATKTAAKKTTTAAVKKQ